jgi:hypothetical protein
VIPILALIKGLPELSRDAFREHYEKIHCPLALEQVDRLERYVRYHVERDLHGAVHFDVLTAFWYPDEKEVNRVLELLAGEAGAAIRADELTFMDKPANRFFPVSERRLAAGEEGDEHTFVLLSRPGGMSRFECSKGLVRDHWPALCKRLVSPPTFALLRDAFPMDGREPPCDAVFQIRVDDEGGLARWLRSLEAEGFGVRAVRTRRHETTLA